MHQYFHVRKDDDVYDVVERCLHRAEKLRDFFGFRFPDSQFVAVFDNPNRTLFRRALWPEFKSTRTKHEGLPEIEASTKEAFSRDADWISVEAPEMFECDDVIATLARGYDGKVLIHSNDQDFHSCLEENRVTIIKKSNTPERGKAMEIEYFTSRDHYMKFGFLPESWAEYQTLIGGKDDVPGWDNVGKKTATRVLLNSENIYSIDIRDPKLELNSRQRDSYPEFLEMLPTLLVVRTLRTTLIWPDNIRKGDGEAYGGAKEKEPMPAVCPAV